MSDFSWPRRPGSATARLFSARHADGISSRLHPRKDIPFRSDLAPSVRVGRCPGATHAPNLGPAMRTSCGPHPAATPEDRVSPPHPSAKQAHNSNKFLFAFLRLLESCRAIGGKMAWVSLGSAWGCAVVVRPRTGTRTLNILGMPVGPCPGRTKFGRCYPQACRNRAALGRIRPETCVSFTFVVIALLLSFLLTLSWLLSLFFLLSLPLPVPFSFPLPLPLMLLLSRLPLRCATASYCRVAPG